MKKNIYIIILGILIFLPVFLNKNAFASAPNASAGDKSYLINVCNNSVSWFVTKNYTRRYNQGSSAADPIVFLADENSGNLNFEVYALTIVCNRANAPFNGSITNLKVVNIDGVYRREILSGTGQPGTGNILKKHYYPGMGFDVAGSFNVEIARSALLRLEENKVHNLRVKSVSCIRMDRFYPGDWTSNMSAYDEMRSLRGAKDQYGLISCGDEDFDLYVKVIRPNRFRAEGQTKAAVLDSKQALRSDDSNFKNNGRNNPQIAKVGKWVSFSHTARVRDFNKNEPVRGIGSFSVNRDFSGTVSQKSGFVWNKSSGKRDADVIRQGYISDGLNSTNEENEIIKITKEMSGKTICSSMNYTIDAINGEGGIRIVNGKYNWTNMTTNEACVYVPYNFDVTPCVKIDKIKNCSGGDIDVPTDGKIPPDPNNGEEIEVPDNGTGTSPIKYKITTWRVPAAREGRPTVNNKRENENGDTCAADNFYWQDYQGLENCKVVREDSSGRPYDKNTRIADFVPGIEEGAEAGTRYCVALSISPYKMSDTQSKAEQDANIKQWRHSAPVCIKVVKKPKVQFWGNGVFSRAGIRTSLSSTNRGVLGSWVEYEAITGGTIHNFRTESSQSTHRLAIENYVLTGSFGQGASSIQSVISSIESKFPRQNIDNSAMTVNVYDKPTEQIGGFNADRTTKVVYARNLRISGDIINGDRTVNNDSDFRQIIIIADGNITIDPNVRNIDAWLIAKGTINTCAVDGFQNIQKVTTEKCNERLQIRGGTLSDTLKLWRTHGSDGKTVESLSEPAEIINQSADTYLWGQAQSGGQGKIVTTYTKELPVRY